MYEVHAAAFRFYYIHLLQGQSRGCSSWLCRGRFSSQTLGGSVTLELLGMFSELVFTWKEKALCGSRLLLNSSNPRMTNDSRGGLRDEDRNQARMGSSWTRLPRCP